MLDPDQVTLDNLNRQVAYRTDQVGQPKAALLAGLIGQLNPTIRVVGEQVSVNAASVSKLLAKADLVLECSDDPATKFLVNDYCVPRGKALVIGGAVGLAGQVVAVAAAGACYRCLFGGPSEAASLTCRDAGVLGPLVGIIGSLQALEAIKMGCGPTQEAGGDCSTSTPPPFAGGKFASARPRLPVSWGSTLGNRP